MTLFLLSIWCAGREFIDAVISIHQLSLSIHWQFQVIQGLCFRWQFKGQHWHTIFDNSMPQPWLTFCYWFDALVVNSLTLLITYVCCHSVFIEDFKFNRDSVFADDLWISSDKLFLQFHTSAMILFLLLIWCVGREFIDIFDYIRVLSLGIHWRFQV
jgi:hypothetical protein